MVFIQIRFDAVVYPMRKFKYARSEISNQARDFLEKLHRGVYG